MREREPLHVSAITSPSNTLPLKSSPPHLLIRVHCFHNSYTCTRCLSLSLSHSFSRFYTERDTYTHSHSHACTWTRARALHIPRRRGGRGKCQRSAVRAQGRPWRRARLGSLPRHTPPPRHWRCGHGNPTPHNNNKKKIKKLTERKRERERQRERGTAYTHKAKKGIREQPLPSAALWLG